MSCVKKGEWRKRQQVITLCVDEKCRNVLSAVLCVGAMFLFLIHEIALSGGDL